MKILDNSPIESPSVGQIVTETREVKGLQNCHLYLLSSNDESIAAKAKDVFDMLMEKMRDEQLLNYYEIEFLDNVDFFSNHLNLYNAITTDRGNLIMPLNAPDTDEKQYLITHTEESDLFTHLPLIIYTSERVTKNSVIELMIKEALNDTDAFIEKTKSLLETDDVIKRYSIGHATANMLPTFGMAFNKVLVKEAFGKDVKYTHQKQIELQKELIDNIKEIKVDKTQKEKLARVKLILGSISNEDILEYLLNLSDEERSAFAEQISPAKMAEKSKVKINVRYVGHIDVKKPADGCFRVFFDRGSVSVQVHFGRRSALLIYLIYLMDVVRSEDVNSLNIREYGDLYKRLFEACYGYDGGKEQFKTLIGKGNSEQELLRHCYNDITKSVGKVCSYYGESKTPFIIPDAQSHLYVLKKNIAFDERLLKYF